MKWNPRDLFCTVTIGSPFELAQPSEVRETAGHYESAQPSETREPTPPIERRYSTIEAKVRLHQAEFRERVLSAYDRRCSVSGLPIPQLLQAAHVIPDRDKRGQPDITNGLCLSIPHHSADDRHLLGIDPDGRILIAESVLEQHDGPMLEAGSRDCMVNRSDFRAMRGIDRIGSIWLKGSRRFGGWRECTEAVQSVMSRWY